MASRKKQLPWRTLVEIPDDQFGRFTREQVEAAVDAVMARRKAREARARGRTRKDPASSGTPDAKPSRKKARGSTPKPVPGEATVTAAEELPWRTLVEIPDDQYGRFTREQIREAVRAVKAEREALARSKEDRGSDDAADVKS